MKRITSRHHPLVAFYRALARGRGTHEHVLLDGLHLVQEACRSGFIVDSAALGTSVAATPEGKALAASLEASGAEVVEAADSLLEAMSPVASPTGIVAAARRPAPPLMRAFDNPPQLVVIGIDMQDPGNVGALARAAEAGGATGLVLCGTSADPFGWKSLRGSMGSLLRLPTVAGLPWQEAVDGARAAGVRIVATVPRGGMAPDGVDACRPIAFLLGGEGPGLPDEAVAAADARVTIPMRPPVESLNVAVAGALLVYEAARQREDGGRRDAAERDQSRDIRRPLRG